MFTCKMYRPFVSLYVWLQISELPRQEDGCLSVGERVCHPARGRSTTRVVSSDSAAIQGDQPIEGQFEALLFRNRVPIARLIPKRVAGEQDTALMTWNRMTRIID